MKLTILGCYSATPRSLNNPTAQILELGGELMLIDCGEGTQVQLRKLKIKFSRINHVFISHLHGDHFFGLPGLVSTFRLLGREKPLFIYGPKGIKEALTLLLKLGDSWTQYPLHFRELSSQESEVLLDTEKLRVQTLPLNHRIYTNGFIFKGKPGPRKLLIEKARALGVEKAYYRKIKLGADAVSANGQVIPNQEITEAPPRPWSYAFCSDTAFEPGIVPALKGVRVLYHEATFLETEVELAGKTGHSTAKQAGEIAGSAGVEDLILGHFSTRYKDKSMFLKESPFSNTHLAEDGKEFTWMD